ncbi:MAG: AAA family ATPase [Paludibacteraceae bacterium]|nr:AAA family ATPase [Paludibacteraceae bacterium]
MSNILIDKIRIDGFRGLKNFEMSLSETSVLTGMNNAGKTSVLKALQIVFGNYSFLSAEDLHIEDNVRSERIIVDVRLVSVDNDGRRIEDFSDDWDIVLKAANIEHDLEGNAYVAFRSVFTTSATQSYFTRETKKLVSWEQESIDWLDLQTTTKFQIPTEQLPFFYIEAQRDILDDVRQRNSFLGRMLGNVAEHYSREQIEKIETMIAELNQQAIENSDILTDIQSALSGLDSTMDKHDSKVSIQPFAKKLRDLNKGLSIQYGTESDSFTMDYHGMGTRSWSSLLTFKAFLKLLIKTLEEGEVCCPIIAIEEPESHLHPNAQRQLFSQLVEMSGQKVISTHSPYIAACAKLSEIKCLHKDGFNTSVGVFNSEGLHPDDIRNVERQVVLSHGELLFSKAIILFEGETEAQALPIFAEKVFNMPAFNCGVNFVGVGGYGFYAPFVRFAEAYNIPWFIFSDGEQDAINGVSSAIKKALCDDSLNIDDMDNIFVIPDGKAYEGYITSLNYLDEFKAYHKRYIENTETDPRAIAGKQRTVDRLTAADYKKKAEENKTTWASIMAFAIAESTKPLPPLVDELFNKVKEDLTNV